MASPSLKPSTWPGVAAKFLAPQLPAHHVARPRLDALLVPPSARVTVIVAPPGAGKTVLVVEWLSAHPEVRAAWVSLEDSDGSPTRFWTVVVHALQAVEDRLGLEALDRLLEGDQSGEEVLGSIVADIEMWATEPIVLVLEDYHVLGDRRVHEQLAWFLDHRPAALKVIITSRADPSLPLGRWRVRNELAEVRAADLRFDEAEADALLGGFSGLHLDDVDRRALEERTEGWAAGLQLAALALQRAEDQHHFVSRFDGTERTVAEFLFQEVLDHQPQEVQDFLLQTSALDALAPSLCDAVTGRSDGASMLRRLEASQLFVVRLDPSGEWFRYHRLFADLLRSELRTADPGAIGAIHERAAAWYDAHELPGAAIGHARAAGDVDLLLSIISRNAGVLWSRGFTDLIRTALATIPASALDADVERAIDYAWALSLTGWVDEGLAWVDRVEGRLPAGSPLRGLVAAGYAVAAGNRGDAEDFAARYEALRDDTRTASAYPDAIGFARLYAQRLLALTEQPDTRRAAYHHTLAIAGTAVVVRSGSPGGALAEGLAVEGRLTEAQVEADRALAAWEADEEAGVVPAICDALRARALVHLECGELTEAEALVESGLPAAEALGVVYHAGMCAALLAEISRARGDIASAIDRVVASGRRLRGISPGADLQSRLAEVAVRAALDEGDLPAAERWAAEVVREPAKTAVSVRLALARADTASARGLLERHEPATLRRKVEQELLFARATLDQRDDALGHVARALDLAAGEPLGWTFAQERELVPLLEDPTVAGRVPPYIRATDPSAAPEGSASGFIPALVEQLSEREVRVLQLLPSHLANQQIANDLFVSLNTVKTHLKSIYRKLGASSRSEAVAAARGHGLLP